MNLEQAKALGKKEFHRSAAKLKFETRNFIDGKFVAAAKGRTFESINPATGETFCEVARSDVDAAGCLETMTHYTQTKSVWIHLG